MKKLFSSKIFLIIGAATAFLGLSAGAVYLYLTPKSYTLHEKQPTEVSVRSVSHPMYTTVRDDGIVVDTVEAYFSDAAFKLGLSEEELNRGLTVNPPVKGSWSLPNDRTLRLTPSADWIPAAEYTVRIADSLLSDGIVLKDRTFSFRAPDFRATAENKDFYESPQDVRSKHAVATFSFTYPLQTKDLQKQIRVYSDNGEEYDFTYNLTDQDHKLHVMSSPVTIKKDADFINIEVDKVANAYNDRKLQAAVRAVVSVPGISDFFKVTSVDSRIVRNEQKENRPEQILLTEFSTAVSGEEAKANIELYVSDETYCGNLQSKSAKKNDNEKTALVSAFPKLELNRIDSGQKAAKTYNFRYDYSGEPRCLVVLIKRNIRSEEGYKLGSDEVYFLPTSAYPVEAGIAFDGAVLPLKSDKNLPLVSRGADKLKVKVARIASVNLNHLVTQTGGNFATPYFINRYSFNEDNIAEVFEKELSINLQHPADQVYSSLDLGEYFQDKKGIFLVKVSGSLRQSGASAEDSRLIVITDLGIIVKDNADGTHAVLVSSIAEEGPVEGALVEVLGKNGRPVVSGYTDAQGFTEIPDFSAFRNDKQAVVYKVSRQGDLSYLPVNRYDRRTDVSRFDVGGVYDDDYMPKDIVSAYGFSDRGIYRPGEEAYFGLIVRQKDLSIPQNLPMSLEIRNQNDDKVAEKKVWPDKFGLIEYKYSVPSTAGLGRYSLNLRQIRGNNEYYPVASVSFSVQEFMPDTMRIKLKLEDAPAKGWYRKKDVRATVDLQNLYGNPASGHKVKGNYTLVPASFSFKEFEGYHFRDPLRVEGAGLASYQKTLPEAETDADGRASLAIDLNEYTEGTYRLNINVDGLELTGGRGVSASAGMLVSPNAYLVGFKADGDLNYIYKSSVRQVRLVAVDSSLQPIALSDLKLSLYQREYVSSLVQMPDRTYRYKAVPVEKKLKSEDFSIDVGGSSCFLNTEAPGDYYLQAEDADGNVVMRIDYSVTGDTNSTYTADTEAGLEIKLNRSEYSDGEQIQMQISAPYSGYGLITIEREKVYAYKWFKSETSSTTQEIELPQGIEGNAYVNVSWIRSLDSDKIFVSPLSYAVVPFSINKSARRLKIGLNAPATVKPGRELTIEYQADYPGEVIIYGVNTGILQVARYQTPQPLNYFIQKKALQVVTSQILDLILPDIKIVRYLKGIGGDMETGAKPDLRVNPFARKQNRPVVFWSGIIPVETTPRTYVYQVPENFNGEIKIMAVGVSERRMGEAERQTAVRGDFALVPSGAYNVSPGDVFDAAVSVANMMENSPAIPVEVRLMTGQGLEVVGNDVQVLKLAYGEEGQARFKVKSGERLGSVPLVFSAANRDNSDQSSRISYEAGIRPASSFVSENKMGFAANSLKLKDFVRPMFEEYRSQEVVASASPLVLTQGLLTFLNAFPHFCTEQSVSKVFPAMEIFFNKPELLKDVDIYALYDDVLAKLTERQTLEGSFKAWSSEWSQAKEYDSLYALHFLLSARKNNLEVPASLLNKALQYARNVAARPVLGATDDNPAYAAYLLTLNGEMTSGYLTRIERDLRLPDSSEARSSLASAYLAASYKLLQNDTKARQLTGYYKTGRNTVKDARYIYLTAVHFPDDLKSLGQESVEALLKPLKQGNFTTASAGNALLALNAVGRSDSDNDILFNGVKYQGKGFARFPLDASVKELEVASDRPFYYVISENGFLKEPAGKQLSQGLEISKTYLNKDGERLQTAEIGDEITVVLKIRSQNGKYVNDVAIVDLIPGCLEMVQNSLKGETDNYELREDRALVYLTASPSARTVTYKTKVIARGSFVVPPAVAEALYDPAVRATTKADRIDVEP